MIIFEKSETVAHFKLTSTLYVDCLSATVTVTVRITKKGTNEEQNRKG